MEEHDRLVDLAGLYVLGALDGSDRRAFEAHLATCAHCTAEVRSFDPVVSALAVAAGPIDPAGAVRTMIVRRLQRQPGFSRPWLATAAVALLAIALGGYAAQLRGRVGRLEAQLREATFRAEAGDRQMADARRATFDAQSSVAVLAAPDVARVDLGGQPAAPAASARAYWSRSRGLVFTASDLPAAPAGRTYQLWILAAQPAPISAGLLKPDANGGVTARFDTPLDLPKPVAMAVTLEPEGGVPSPTGEKYLVGVVN